MRSFKHQAIAEKAAAKIRDLLNVGRIDAGLILGTGWGSSLKLDNQREVEFCQLPGFNGLRGIEGHARKVLVGELAGKTVAALSGRVHLNEAPSDPGLAAMVRLQTEMLIQLGAQNLIVTCAAGALGRKFAIGNICVIDGFVTLYAPEMPLFAGEFCSPEDTLDEHLRNLAFEAAFETEPRLAAGGGGHVMVRGPFFESRRYDKKLLEATGASVVGMSVLPECCVAALYPGTKILALALVTNSDVEEHSHETNLERAKNSSAALGSYLRRIVSRL
ncbi:MAG: hypothetical protein WCT10_00260 [Patescibacteria group bacterium]|jgi:purine-nucleoside phosphorylase